MLEVRMRKTDVILAAVLAACSPTLLQAQPPAAQTTAQSPSQSSIPLPLDARWFAGFTGGGLAGGDDFSRSVQFELYDEQAQFTSEQNVSGGGFLDVFAAARVTRSFGAGVAYTRFGSDGGATFSGTLPHPLEFDSPRPFSGTANELDHDEQAVHLSAIWFVPFTDKVDFHFSAGPTIFNVEQAVIRGISFSENPPDFTEITIDTVDIVSVKETGAGFHFGADMTYALTTNFGAGAMLRFSRGSLTLDLGEGQSVEMDAGGFQFGVGVRARF
jgi:hypothetical protein